MRGWRRGGVAALTLALAATSWGAERPNGDDLASEVRQLREAQRNLRHSFEQLAKAIDDIAWFHRIGDVALFEKWRIVGPPDPNPKNPKAPGATNPVKFYTYTFVPRDRAPGSKLPMLVLPHGGVHSNFTTYYAHIVRELVEQGYVIVAPEYRGSTGYGRRFYELIDYGGLEVEDVHASKEWALKTFDFVDPKRVGLIGWSHGGLISLMASFAHPKDYVCIFAGVPVSDLVARMGYHNQGYLDLYSADFHVGKTVREDIEEYKRRSPVWNVDKLAVPLLVHTSTNDEDVNYLEVEHLIQALKAAGKKFEHEVFQDAPGGHSFDRMATPLARNARKSIYRFLARHLHPPRPQN